MIGLDSEVLVVEAVLQLALRSRLDNHPCQLNHCARSPRFRGAGPVENRKVPCGRLIVSGLPNGRVLVRPDSIKAVKQDESYSFVGWRD